MKTKNNYKWYIFIIVLVISCSFSKLDIMSIMKAEDERLVIINRNAFTLTDVDISLNGAYNYKVHSITAGERHEIPWSDLVNDAGRAYSLAFAEYNTVTIRARQGKFKGEWKK